MRSFLSLSVIALILSLSVAAWATEPNDQQAFELACVEGEAQVFIGDHQIGMAHIRIDGVDPWSDIELIPGGYTIIPTPHAEKVEVWVDLDGQELDLTAHCTTTTTTTPTSLPPKTTTSTVPPTTSTVPPATTTTTTTIATTTTTSAPPTTTTSIPTSDCSDDPTRWDCANTGVDGDAFVWIGFFSILLLTGGIALVDVVDSR